MVLLTADYGLPTPTPITLSNVKDGTDEFIFDAQRLTGAERCQGISVRLFGVWFSDTSAWAPDADLIVENGTGRTLPVKLGRSSSFSTVAPPTGVIDLVGIFDQEDPDAGDGLVDGYRLWIMNAEGIQYPACVPAMSVRGLMLLGMLTTLSGIVFRQHRQCRT